MVIRFKEAVKLSPQLSAVLEGLLEPVLEDRLTAADALSLLSGRQPQQIARCHKLNIVPFAALSMLCLTMGLSGLSET